MKSISKILVLSLLVSTVAVSHDAYAATMNCESVTARLETLVSKQENLITRIERVEAQIARITDRKEGKRRDQRLAKAQSKLSRISNILDQTTTKITSLNNFIERSC